jgi:hypothetical protein
MSTPHGICPMETESVIDHVRSSGVMRRRSGVRCRVYAKPEPCAIDRNQTRVPDRNVLETGIAIRTRSLEGRRLPRGGCHPKSLRGCSTVLWSEAFAFRRSSRRCDVGPEDRI